MKNRLFLLLYSLILALIVISCTPQKISRANFDKLQPGMTVEEVVNILGEPTSSSSLSFGSAIATSASWDNRNVSISVQFLDGKLKLKKIVEGVTTPREQ